MTTRGLTLVALLMAASMAGCMSVNGDASALSIDAKVLARDWGVGSPRANVVSSIAGEPWRGDINAPPVVADLDGDGRDEVLVHGTDRYVRVFDVASGKERGKMPVTYPPSWHAGAVINPVAVGSLDGTGTHVIVASPAAIITAWDVARSGDRLVFEKRWEWRGDSCHRNPGMDAGPVLVDLDGVPGDEILVQTEQIGFYAVSGAGKTLWKQCWAGGNSAPVADDLDGDGDIEAVFASDSGFISVVDGKTGAPQWTFDAGARKYGIAPASIVTSPTIADIDGKGQKEVLFTARHAPRDDAKAFDTFHMAIFAVHQGADYQAELLWMRQPQWAHPMSNTQLVVKDVDGDGRADIFGMDWNTIGHNPGAWEPLNETHVFRLDAEGNDVWVRALPAWWSNKQILVSDADGDGKAEVLVATPRDDTDGIWRLDAATGKPEGFLTAGGWSISGGPVKTSQGLAVVARAEGQDRVAVILYGGVA